MRPDESDAAYVWDMVKHANGVVEAVRERRLEEYLADEDFRMAIERRVEIIGEAARRISTAFREAHADIPWRSIIGQRHALAHDYGEIDDNRIWRVATVHIPDLIERLRPLLPPLPVDPDEE